jgi:hypothetical protein
MSGPQPPFGAEVLKSIVQFGGPINVTTNSTTAAITFNPTFADTTYQLDLEWVSGTPPAAGYYTKLKTTQYAIEQFAGQVVNSYFNWQAWRLV